MKREKHLGLVISNELHYKLKYIAEYDGRSLNGQVIYLINKCIKNRLGIFQAGFVFVILTEISLV